MRLPTLPARVVALLGLVALAVLPGRPAAAQHRLPEPMRAALAQAGLPADALGAVALPIDHPGRPWAHRAEAPTAPASTMKVVTGAVALDRLAPEHRGFAELRGAAPQHGDVRQGDLVIQCGEADLGAAGFRALPSRLRALGVVSAATSHGLEGIEIVSRMTLADRPCRQWSRDWESARVSDSGGRVTIEMQGSFPRHGSAPDGSRLLVRRESRLPGELVRHINQESDNPQARLRFLSLGLKAMETGRHTPTAELAAGAVRAWLGEQDISTEGLVPDNGSGLSRMKGGRLRDVLGLAGYVRDAEGRWWAVVALLNHAQATRHAAVLHAVVDATARGLPWDVPAARGPQGEGP